jgi:hypothetical protein
MTVLFFVRPVPLATLYSFRNSSGIFALFAAIRSA